MPPARRLVPVLALLVALMAPAATAAEPGLEAEFALLLNQERAAAGLAALEPSPALAAEAAAHSQEMAHQHLLHHSPPTAVDTTRWRALGENVGVGGEVGALHRAFLASPAHRANVLGDWTHLGIGVIVDDAGVIWVTVRFASAAQPRPAAPAIGRVDTHTGIWHLPRVGGGESAFYFGNPTDTPFVGDWDCDGIDTPGLYRWSDGYVYLRNSNTAGVADIRYYFGNPGDVPLVGDFDGDGCDTVSLYRPSERRVYVVNRLGSGDRGLGRADRWYPVDGPVPAIPGTRWVDVEGTFY